MQAKDWQRSDALEEVASEHGSVDMAEAKSRRWQRMTGSTEYPASSLRRTFGPELSLVQINTRSR